MAGYFELVTKHRTAELLNRKQVLSVRDEMVSSSSRGSFEAGQSNLRRTLIRTHIQETSFVSSGAMLGLITILLCIGLVLAELSPLWRAVFVA
jgi:hypothetical protein